jgi:hypothetical protein
MTHVFVLRDLFRMVRKAGVILFFNFSQHETIIPLQNLFKTISVEYLSAD